MKSKNRQVSTKKPVDFIFLLIFRPYNDIGEFLTAYYILNTVFRLTKRQRLDEEAGEAFSWPKVLKKEWYIGLIYTPLFTRPVILNMIHELSAIFQQNYGFTTTEVQVALDARFSDELRDIISGEAFDTLHEILNTQGNSYKHPELMVHIAVYSVNLVLLRATICGNSFTFTDSLGSADDWQKLTHIWRYAFSEEELVSLSDLFVLDHTRDTYTLAYVYDENAADQANMLSKLVRLVCISEALGDDAIFAVLNSAEGRITPKIQEILKEEKLELKTRYALNELSMCLTSSELLKFRKRFATRL